MVDLTRRGCLKRFATFLAILASIILISSILTYKQFDGKKGIKRWVVSKAIDNTQKLALKQRPDGISQKEIEQTFKRLKYASKNNQVDLTKLYHILKEYQDLKNPPSSEEMAKFLEDIQSTIIQGKT